MDDTTLHDLGFEALPYLSNDAVSEILVYCGEHLLLARARAAAAGVAAARAEAWVLLRSCPRPAHLSNTAPTATGCRV